MGLMSSDLHKVVVTAANQRDIYYHGKIIFDFIPTLEAGSNNYLVSSLGIKNQTIFR
jgi:aspartate 1-decarboxylase